MTGNDGLGTIQDVFETQNQTLQGVCVPDSGMKADKSLTGHKRHHPFIPIEFCELFVK